MDILVAAGGAAWETQLIARLERQDSINLVRRCVDVADLLAVAPMDLAEIVLVDAWLPGLDADVVHRLGIAGLHVVAVEAERERCVRLGIKRSIAVASLDDSALSALEESPISRAPESIFGGRMIAVWGPSGAPGRSTLALSLAAAFAAQHRSALLIDADTYGGSLAQMLAVLDEVSGLLAACRAANQGQPCEEHFLEIDLGLRLLTGIQRADMWQQVRAGALEQVLLRSRELTDIIVVDCGFGLADPVRDEVTRLIMQRADAVAVIGSVDPVGLARLVRSLHELRSVCDAPTVSAINRMRPSIGWDIRDITATVHRLSGVTPEVFLPYDRLGLDKAMVLGRPLLAVCSQSSYLTQIDQMAALLLDAVAAGARR